MEKFDYQNDMADSIKNYLAETDERNYDTLYDELWTVDEVTHNMYTHNEPEAKDHVLENIDLLKEALYEFGTPDKEIAKHFMNEDWGWFDTTIRCSVLGAALQQALEEEE